MITTPRLHLRPPIDADAEALMPVFGDARAMTYIGDGSARTIEQVRDSLKKRLACLDAHAVTLWTVELRVPIDGVDLPVGTVIGDCGVFPVAWDGPEFELAYRYRHEVWGQGIAGEAAMAAIAHAWEATDFDRILGLAYSGNVASRRVLEKTGMIHQGTTDRYYGVELEWYAAPRPDRPESA